VKRRKKIFRKEAVEVDNVCRALFIEKLEKHGPDDLVLTCAPMPLGFNTLPGNIQGVCRECQMSIYWRPWVPAYIPKICIGCAGL